jgi:hypothetical protein
MYHEASNGLLLPESSNGHKTLQESQHDLNVMLLESRIFELESRLQEDGWLRLDRMGSSEFNRETIGRIADLGRVAYLKNPLINRAVEIGALYVWGQNLSVSATDDNVQPVIERFWEENRHTLTGQQASRALEVELQVTGNIFLALFPDLTTGTVRVRPMPIEDVKEIVTNPEDRYEPWFYKREWKQRTIDGKDERLTAYYPDWRFRPDNPPDSINDIPIRWDAPLLHVKSGAFPHWRWGVSEIYAALDWARAYKEQLEDDATRSRAMARFAWKLTTPGGAAGVAAARTKLGTTFGVADAGETNPPPVGGATFIQGEGVNMDPIRLAGTTLPTDHSRPARLMASSGLGLPDHFFDADVGNHATASTLDRPTELRFSERRQMWLDVYSELMQWVIDVDLIAPGGLLSATPNDEAREVTFSWPDLLERSITERVSAVREAATLNSQTLAGTMTRETTAREMLVAIGVEDVDGEIARLEEEWFAQDERREAMAALAQRAAQTTTTPAPEETDDDETVEREAFTAALRDLREALRDIAHIR